MLRFPMITDFLLTVTVFPLKRFILSGLKLNAIIRALSRPVKKGFGFTVWTPLKILTLWLTFHCLQQLTPPLSLIPRAPTARLNPLKELLKSWMWIFIHRLCAFRFRACFAMPVFFWFHFSSVLHRFFISFCSPLT